jgi:hypothetical protein
MKKIFTIILLLASFIIKAQVYNNEWIDFSKTYYKFKVGATGLYRIPQSVLATAGLGNVPAQNFQLFRNGQEVPIYTSAASGVLGASDYIEFWGEMNDGKADKQLYYNPAYQHTTKWSLQTDTAVFFLTANPTGNSFHFLNASNDTTGNILSAEPYFMYKTGSYFKSQINPGFASYIGEYVYSSSYDIGEFWSSGAIRPGSPFTDNQNNLYVYSGAGSPDANLRFGATGCQPDTRTMQVKVNGNIIQDTTMDGYNDLVSGGTVPVSSIASNAASIQYVDNSTITNDYMVASFYELTYPRQFNFNGQSNFFFELPAKSAGYYLNISNFNKGASTPVLYDITNGARYSAIVNGGTLSFVLPGSSSTRKLVLVNEDASNIQTVTALTTKNFINYNLGANQGNYFIISNPILYVGSSNNNPIIDYKNYRNSAAGGSFNAIVIDINELVDQFAFGIKKHPSSIKNFLNFARNTFAVKPQYAFLIGHGMSYDEYRTNESNPYSESLNLVPTFGYPASDNKLSSLDGAQVKPLTPIGRLSVINGPEIEAYLQKVKEVEQVQQTSPNTIAGRLWMKNYLQVTGASDPYLGAVLCNYMSSYQQIIQDTLTGGSVTTICNGNTQISDISNEQAIANLFTTGLSVINYFGHSSATTLQDNLNDPSNYNNKGQGKYPVFYANGCNAGDFFVLDPGRFSGGKTLSETWVLAKESGMIAFIASTHFGIVNYLNILLNGLFTDIATTDYGKSIGIIQADVLQNIVTVAPGDYYARLTAEEMTLHGDPAIKLNTESLPDYDVESQEVLISPSPVSVANQSFSVTAHFFNLGKAIHDSIAVQVSRQFPNGVSRILLIKKIPAIIYEDSIQLTVPISGPTEVGQNYITVTVNSQNNVQEVTTMNNSVTSGIYIYQDGITPVSPYNYAIINNRNQKLEASTANPLSPSAQYVMQIDTSTLFNSPLLVSKNVTSIGGLLEFDPGFSYSDSVVYYWRTSVVPAQGSPYIWSGFSFIYIDSNRSGPGFNQSHYYQHLQSGSDSISLDGARKWDFGIHYNNLFVNNTIYPTGSPDQASFYVSINNNSLLGPGCNYNELIFNVIDPITFKPWVNNFSGSTGLYNSELANCGIGRDYNFDFLYTDSINRKKAMNFLDSIPKGFYVVIRSNSSPDVAFGGPPNVFINQWKADTAVYGSGNSLYNKLINLGWFGLDSFYTPRAISFVYKKGDPSFKPQYGSTQGIYDKISFSVNCPSPDVSGYITSPKFGPAKQWKQLHWRGSSLESPSTDSVGLQVIGVDTAGNTTPLLNLNIGNQDYDISSINASQYPYLQLKLTASDTIHLTPYQLKYWRLTYLPVPEGALAPNLFYKTQDTVALGQPLQFAVAFKNISISAFDSMAINISIIDHNNVTHLVHLPKGKPLISGDTLIVNYFIDTKTYTGANTIFLEVNPNNSQPEEYHFNNFMYKTFYVKTDNTKPLLDVTFDGVHILNQDIVSAKPHITIKLKDESKYLLLTDTSLVSLQLRYPDGSLHSYSFSSDTLRFTPATSTSDNTATVDFYPSFLKQYNPEGDVYTLIVTGKDASGNPAGTASYQVSFTVITKAMISNMLNYPNPFTTSTAFVFTITGSQVPQNIKIQILTITGKIVREITEDQLGPLHVGTNITEFKWNGTDMYGQRLGNGVYLYHVVTNLNGKALDTYTSANDNTNQYFVKGYGKMYLMR